MTPDIRVRSGDMPGLFQAANSASALAQRRYYIALRVYLFILVAAAISAFVDADSDTGAALAALLFLLSLGILIWLRVKRPDAIWYNGRAVAESVKTRAWRFMMRADPYEDTGRLEIMRKRFLADLKEILDQNRTLAPDLCPDASLRDPISDRMLEVRALPVLERIAVYRRDRIHDQAAWYAAKSVYNRRRAGVWFAVSVTVHAAAIGMLLLRLRDAGLVLPVGVASTVASAVLTWLKAKKHNELSSSYTLAANEIVLIKAEGATVDDEAGLAEFVVNAETAFSREHTQWAARKTGA